MQTGAGLTSGDAPASQSSRTTFPCPASTATERGVLFVYCSAKLTMRLRADRFNTSVISTMLRPVLQHVKMFCIML